VVTLAKSAWSRNNTAERCIVRKNGEQAIEHAVCGFAHCKHADIRKSSQVIFAIETTEPVTGNGETALGCGARVQGFEGAAKDPAGDAFAVHWLEV